jgi:hypothetical protein
MASTITQVEKLVGKRIRRREDPRLITGTHLCRRHSDAGHALRGDSSQPARSCLGYVRSTPKKRRKLRASRRSTQVKTRPKLGRSRVAHHCRDCASHITTSWRRTAFTSLVHPGGRGRRDRQVPGARCCREDRNRWDVLPAVLTPRRQIAAGAPPCHPEWPDNVAFQLSPGRRRRGQGLRRGGGGGEAAHHQPAPDPSGHGDRGVVAEWRAGGPPVEPLYVRRKCRIWCARW